MKKQQFKWNRGFVSFRYGAISAAVGLAACGLSATAGPIRYVAGDGVGNDANDGMTESTPVRTLQIAINSLLRADGTGKIIVAPGVYMPIIVPNAPITIESREGPEGTIIDGGGIARCATLGIEDERLINGGTEVPPIQTVLSGFTLRNGNTDGMMFADARFGGGGAFSGRLMNCIITGNSSAFGGGVSFASLTDCVISNNTSSADGGGVAMSTLVNCVISSNVAATHGGGVAHGILNACTIVGNQAQHGGGVAGGFIMANSKVSANISENGDGGGVYGKAIPLWDATTPPFAKNCDISDNIAKSSGGGAVRTMLFGCLVSGNMGWNDGGIVDTSALQCLITKNHALEMGGGGASDSQLINCTVTGNTTDLNLTSVAAGIHRSMAMNSIVSGNFRGPAGTTTGPEDNSKLSLLSYSFTIPEAVGNGNVTADNPGFQGENDYRLTAESPCVDRGNTAVTESLIPSLYASFDSLKQHGLVSTLIVRCGEMGGLMEFLHEKLVFSTDFSGKPRVYNEELDIGCYEFNGIGMNDVRLPGLDGTEGTADDLTITSSDDTPPVTNAFGHVIVPAGGIVAGGTDEITIVIDGTDAPLTIPSGSLITPQGIIIIGGHTVNPDGTISVDAGSAIFVYMPDARPVIAKVPDTGATVNPDGPSVTIGPNGPTIAIPSDVPGSEAELAVPVITAFRLEPLTSSMTLVVSNCVALTSNYTLLGTSDLTKEFKELPYPGKTMGYAIPNGIWVIPGIPTDGAVQFFLKVSVSPQKVVM